MTLSVQQKSTHPRTKALSVVLAMVVAIAVAAGSFLPGEEKQALHSSGRFHSLGHFLVFLVVGFLGSRAVSSRRARVVVACAAIALGVAIEYGEHVAFHGAIERKDILVDTLGVVAGSIVALLLAPRE